MKSLIYVFLVSISFSVFASSYQCTFSYNEGYVFDDGQLKVKNEILVEQAIVTVGDQLKLFKMPNSDKGVVVSAINDLTFGEPTKYSNSFILQVHFVPSVSKLNGENWRVEQGYDYKLGVVSTIANKATELVNTHSHSQGRYFSATCELAI